MAVYNIYLCSDVDVMVVMVTNEYQAESVLYGDNGAVAGMSLRFLLSAKLTGLFFDGGALPSRASILTVS